MTEIEKRVTEGEIIPTIGNWTHVRNLRWKGDVQIWKNVTNGVHIAISRAYTDDHGDETMIFPYDAAAEKVSDWGDLYAGRGEDHETALRKYIRDSSGETFILVITAGGNVSESFGRTLDDAAWYFQNDFAARASLRESGSAHEHMVVNGTVYTTTAWLEGGN